MTFTLNQLNILRGLVIDELDEAALDVSKAEEGLKTRYPGKKYSYEGEDYYQYEQMDAEVKKCRQRADELARLLDKFDNSEL